MHDQWRLHVTCHISTDLEKRVMSENGNKLFIEVMHQKLNAHSKRLKQRNNWGTRKEGHLKISKKLKGKTKMGFIKQFKGTCRTCGEYENKTIECPHKKMNEEIFCQKCCFIGKCFYCAKDGHKISKCHKKSVGEIVKAGIGWKILMMKILS